MSYIVEAFKKLNLLKEDAFDMTSVDGISDLEAFVGAEPSNEEDIIDVEANNKDELRDNYLGCVILECPVCHSLRYAEPDQLEFDVEDEDKPVMERLVNRSEECPYCATTNGFGIVGKVMPYEEENKVDVKVNGEEVEVEEEDDDDLEESMESGCKGGKCGECNESLEDMDKMSDDDYVETTVEELKDNGIDVEGAEITCKDGKCTLKVGELKKLLNKKNESCKVNECGGQPLTEEDETVADVIENADADDFDANKINAPKDVKETLKMAADLCDEALQESRENRIYFPKKDLNEEAEGADFGPGAAETLQTIKELVGESLTESIDDVKVTTDDQELSLNQAEDGTVTVQTKPRTDADKISEFDGGDEMISELSDEDLSDLNLEAEADDLENGAEAETEEETFEVEEPTEEGAAEEETEEAPEGEGEVEEESEEVMEEEEPSEEEEGGANESYDYTLDYMDESSFDHLCESYLKNVYENVESFKSTSAQAIDNKMIVEGVIGFNSGNKKQTTFVFNAADATKTGKVRFIGENKEISRGKKSFVLTGKVEGKKLISESLNYNYMQNKVRVNGTVK